MQRQKDKELISIFNKKVGALLKQIRLEKKMSLRKFAHEYEIDRGNLSRIEKGLAGCQFSTLWKIVESLRVDFPTFATMLCELLKDFTFIDE